MSYRAFVDEGLRDLIAAPMSEEDKQGLRQLMELGLHHEQQHQLLLTDIKYNFGTTLCPPLVESTGLANERSVLKKALINDYEPGL